MNKLGKTNFFPRTLILELFVDISDISSYDPGLLGEERWSEFDDF